MEDKIERLQQISYAVSNINKQIEDLRQKEHNLYNDRERLNAEKHILINGNLEEYIGKYVIITVNTSIDDVRDYCFMEKCWNRDDGRIDICGIWMDIKSNINSSFSVKREKRTYDNGSFSISEISKDEFEKMFDEGVGVARTKLFEPDKEKDYIQKLHEYLKLKDM